MVFSRVIGLGHTHYQGMAEAVKTDGITKGLFDRVLETPSSLFFQHPNPGM